MSRRERIAKLFNYALGMSARRAQQLLSSDDSMPECDVSEDSARMERACNGARMAGTAQRFLHLEMQRCIEWIGQSLRLTPGLSGERESNTMAVWEAVWLLMRRHFDTNIFMQMVADHDFGSPAQRDWARHCAKLSAQASDDLLERFFGDDSTRLFGVLDQLDAVLSILYETIGRIIHGNDFETKCRPTFLMPETIKGEKQDGC